jgi:hypothetical protein
MAMKTLLFPHIPGDYALSLGYGCERDEVAGWGRSFAHFADRSIAETLKRHGFVPDGADETTTTGRRRVYKGARALINENITFVDGTRDGWQLAGYDGEGDEAVLTPALHDVMCFFSSHDIRYMVDGGELQGRREGKCD